MMKRAKAIFKIAVLIFALFHLLTLRNYSMAANNTSGDNYTDKSYVFDLDDLESDEIKELYDLTEEDIPSKYNLNERPEMPSTTALYMIIKHKANINTFSTGAHSESGKNKTLLQSL